MNRFAGSSEEGKSAFGIERVTLRLAVFGAIIIAIFVALFFRLWFLQVLAAPDYQRVARQNRTRIAESEPHRGNIRDRNGRMLVTNRNSLSITVDRQIVTTPRQERKVLSRLSETLVVGMNELRTNLNDDTVSPFKPVAVVTDVSEKDASYIRIHQDDFPGVRVERLPVRRYPRGSLAAHILGYVGEISPALLESDDYPANRGYGPGDIVGKDGVEYTYDRFIRGQPEQTKYVVNSTGDQVQKARTQEEVPGRDLYLTIDARIQGITEKALASGIEAARASYLAPAGGAVVMDPDDGEIIAMASYPDYDPAILADGFSNKDNALLGGTTEVNTDDRLTNRTVLGAFPAGSTFKVVTAEAAIWSGIASPYTYLPCPPAVTYPPEGGPGSVTFNNWTSADYGTMGLSESLEVSCDTFYYALGWQMESAFGAANGDGSEKFQEYMRMAGFGHDTGIDLPYEEDGLVADQAWCEANADIGYCPPAGDWLPGYTVNMAIGQGELTVTPLQMAVTYAAIANGGTIVQPHLAQDLRKVPEDGGEPEIVKEFDFGPGKKLPLDEAAWAPIRQGLLDVISGDQGTATGAFAGYPQDRFPVAGKTGTAQIGSVESGLNYAWFTSYAPADDPEYVIAVYLDRAGHGGESAAPVAREIYEGIFGIDQKAQVQLSQDPSN